MREFQFTATDGTNLLGFDNEAAGPPVVMVPGLATPPTGMPSVTDPGNGFHVVGFNMRGTHGSERPADSSAITVGDHAQDAISLMNRVGFEKAIFVGWSLGVNITFEVACRVAPERVQAVLAVGGVPGATFETLFAPFGVPQKLSRPLTKALYTAGAVVGGAAQPVAEKLPITPELAKVAQKVGAFGPGDPEHYVTFFEAHAKQDMGWVSELARAADAHERLALTDLKIPIAFIAGTRDYMTSAAAVIETAAEVPHATLDVVKGTHTLGLEFPELVLERLRDVAREAGY